MMVKACIYTKNKLCTHTHVSVNRNDWRVAGMVHGLSVSDTDSPLTLRTGVGDQIPPLAASLGTGG